MIRITAYAALAMAGLLLSLQIVGGLEYTQGGSLYTQASMIAAMITLAALPIFIEAARQAGQKGIAVALFTAFLAFLAYSLPATTGRTGEIKEHKAAEAADVTRWRSEAAALTKQLDWTKPDMISECAGAPDPLPPTGWPKCRRLLGTVKSLEGSVSRLNADISKAGIATGDLGSDLWAWALSPLGATPALVRKVSVLAFALGLDVVIWSLIWFATATLSKARTAANDNLPVVASEPLPPATAIPEIQKGAEIVPWVSEFRKRHGRMPRLDEVEAAFPQVARTTAYRRLKAA